MKKKRGRESEEGRFRGILRLDYRGVEVEECVPKAGTLLDR
jgi:hypothetical protein